MNENVAFLVVPCLKYGAVFKFTSTSRRTAGWGEPPGAMIARVLEQELSERLPGNQLL